MPWRHRRGRGPSFPSILAACFVLVVGRILIVLSLLIKLSFFKASLAARSACADVSGIGERSTFVTFALARGTCAADQQNARSPLGLHLRGVCACELPRKRSRSRLASSDERCVLSETKHFLRYQLGAVRCTNVVLRWTAAFKKLPFVLGSVYPFCFSIGERSTFVTFARALLWVHTHDHHSGSIFAESGLRRRAPAKAEPGFALNNETCLPCRGCCSEHDGS